MKIQKEIKSSSDQILILTILYIFHTISDEWKSSLPFERHLLLCVRNICVPRMSRKLRFLPHWTSPQSDQTSAGDFSNSGLGWVFDESLWIVCYKACVGDSSLAYHSSSPIWAFGRSASGAQSFFTHITRRGLQNGWIVWQKAIVSRGFPSGLPPQY